MRIISYIFPIPGKCKRNGLKGKVAFENECAVEGETKPRVIKFFLGYAIEPEMQRPVFATAHRLIMIHFALLALKLSRNVLWERRRPAQLLLR